MKNRVRKYQFVSTLNIGQYESWLSDMAKQGLFLKNIGSVFCEFEKRDPTDMEYRIEFSKYKLSQDQIGVYEDCGWEYVASHKWNYVFCSRTEDHCVELYSDTAEQVHVLKDMKKRMQLSLDIAIFAFILFVANMFNLLQIGNTPYLNLVRNGILYLNQSIYMIIMVLLFTHYCIKLLRLMKQLQSGQKINHHVSWKKSKYRNQALILLLIAIGMIGVVDTTINIIETIKMVSGASVHKLDEVKRELPIVRLADIEQNPNLSFLKDKKSFRGDGYNYVETKKSLLAPVQYEVSENGLVEGEMWEDESGTYSPSIHTKYYKIAFSFLVDDVVQDLIYVEKDLEIYENVKAIKASYEGLDHLYFIDYPYDGESKSVVASKGNVVVSISYYGNKDKWRIVERLAEVLGNKK